MMEDANSARSMKINLGNFVMVLRNGSSNPEGHVRLDVKAYVPESSKEILAGTFVVETAASGFFEDIWVETGKRRQGIATAVYDAIENLGFAIHPSSILDEDGALFWEARKAARMLPSR